MEDKPSADVGDVVGGYRLGHLLGEGAFGFVFHGTHTDLGREGAIKLLRSNLASDEQFVSRFLHEAKVVNQVRHPNIVDVVHFVHEPATRRVAYIMEYIQGASLADFLKGHTFTLEQAVNATCQIADALAAVHDIGVVHRDLKPANIIVPDARNDDFSFVPSIKVLDFGIAKVTGPSVAHRTRTGALLGTPAYMAPEQVAGDPVSAATDVYAIGEIFFEMLWGHALYRGKTMQIFAQKAEGSDIALPALGIPCAEQAEAIVRRCLEDEMDARPSARELSSELRALLASNPDSAGVSRASSVAISTGGDDEASLSGVADTHVRAKDAEPQPVPSASEPAHVDAPAQSAPPPEVPLDARPAASIAPDIGTIDDHGTDFRPPKSRLWAAVAVLAVAVAGIAIALSPGSDQESQFVLADEPEPAKPAVVANVDEPASPTPSSDVPDSPFGDSKAAVEGPKSKAKKYEARGRIAEKAGDLPRAQQNFERCLEAFEYPPCHRALGILYAKQNNREKSVHHMSRYVELAPSAPDAERIKASMDARMKSFANLGSESAKGKSGSKSSSAKTSKTSKVSTKKKKATSKAGTPSVTGYLDKAIIQRVVRQHFAQMRYCYQKALTKNPKLSGKVYLRWIIGPTGAVLKASVSKSTLNDAKVESCLVRNVKRWKFPNPKGGGLVSVTYPFTFSAR